MKGCFNTWLPEHLNPWIQALTVPVSHLQWGLLCWFFPGHVITIVFVVTEVRYRDTSVRYIASHSFSWVFSSASRGHKNSGCSCHFYVSVFGRIWTEKYL